MKSTKTDNVAEVNKLIKTLANSSSENGKLFKNARAAEVKEFSYSIDGKKRKACVVYLPFMYYNEHKNSIKKISNYLTEKLKTHTFVLG